MKKPLYFICLLLFLTTGILHGQREERDTFFYAQSDTLRQNFVFSVDSIIGEVILLDKRHIEWLEDKTGELTIEQVSASKFQHRFDHTPIRRGTWEDNSMVLWFKTQIHNNTSEKLSFYSSVPILFDTVYAYQYKDGGFEKMLSGAMVKGKDKIFPVHNMSMFPHSLDVGETGIYYLQLKKDNYYSLSEISPLMAIYSKEGYDKQEDLTKETWIFDGFFFGIISLMLVFAIALYLIFRRKVYMWFAFALLTILYYHLSYSGIGIRYLYPWCPAIAKYVSIIWAAWFLVLGQVVFIASYLDIRKKLPFLYWVCFLPLLVSLLTILYRINFDFGIYFFENLSYLICTIGIYLAIIILAFKKKERSAKFIFAAQSPTVVAGLILIFQNMQVIEMSPYLAMKLFQIGWIFQALIWTISIADRVILLRKEKNEARQKELELAKVNEKLIREQNIVLDKKVNERTKELIEEKKKSDALLLNILPKEISDELKAKGSAEAKQFDQVSILFTDFVSFTQTAERLSPQQLVEELNECFTAFDNIIERNGLEKIKTIGDAYMAVCGLPVADPKHAKKTVQAALEIRDFIEQRKLQKRTFEIRIGIHSGSVVAGIVGVKKFAYDIWGDTVNTAARMEQSGEPGKINISETTYQLVQSDFTCEYRGEVEAKNKGMLKMYFVETI